MQLRSVLIKSCPRTGDGALCPVSRLRQRALCPVSLDRNIGSVGGKGLPEAEVGHLELSFHRLLV